MKYLLILISAFLLSCEQMSIETPEMVAEVTAVYESAVMVYGEQIKPPTPVTYDGMLDYIRKCDVYEVGDTYQEMTEYDDIRHLLYP